MSKTSNTSEPPAADKETGGDINGKSPAADNKVAKADGDNNTTPADKSAAADNANPPGNADDANAAGDELTAAKQDAADKHELLMRKAAELENLRRRAARDMENAVNLAVEQIALAICEVRDSVAAATEDESQTAEDLRRGVKIILQKTDSVLQVNNILPVRPDSGVIFDPELHMAVATEENADLPPNAIVRILQTGYTVNSRLLRPASVIVSKAPAQRGETPPAGKTGGTEQQ